MNANKVKQQINSIILNFYDQRKVKNKFIWIRSFVLTVQEVSAAIIITLAFWEKSDVGLSLAKCLMFF